MNIKLTPLFLAFSLLIIFPVMSDDSVNKSPSDTREYNVFTLKNGIDVVTVSDPNIVTSAATLSIGVGAFQDPEDAHGIAHFLEHMLFMGSKKYPKPNEYMQFIQENGGDTNAFTAAEQTTYLFSINSSKFEPALDRLSSSIKDPLFDPTMVGKEINAVNSEWLLNRQSDSFIQQRTAANTGNPDHPRTKLGVGNKDTLSDSEEILLRKLRNFYKQYYSANLMKLVLVGKQSPKELKKLATKYFSKIKNYNVERPVTKTISYREQDLGKNIYIKSRVKFPELVIEFPIKNNISLWRSKPNEYIAMLLNSQEPNSLMNFLNEEGYIEEGSASIDPNSWGADGSAFVSFTLTEKGQMNKNVIIANTFKYIDLIKSEGIKKDYFDELAGVNQIQFEDYRTPEALNLAIGFAFNIYDVPLKNLIDYSYVTSDYNPEAIKDVLSSMAPQFSRIYHISPDEDINVTLEYADGGYRVTDLALDLQSSNDIFANLKLPEPQIINLDVEEALFTSSGEYDVPKKIFDEPGVQAFLSHTQNFMGREGVLVLNLKSPIPSQSSENLTYAFISNAVFRKKHRLIFQRAFQRNGISIFSNYDDNGNTAFALVGRTSAQKKYATDLLNKFVNFQYTERDLKDAVKALTASFRSRSVY
jgi:protease-3